MKENWKARGVASLTVVLVVLVAGTGLRPFFFVRAFAATHDPAERLANPQKPPYHKHPPTGPLPETMEPGQFQDEPAAFTAYSVAAQIRGLLYQEPCLCPCRKTQGHQSLLDCYTSRHGVACHACQMELFYIFEANKQHKSPKQIRKSLLKDEWKRVNVARFVAGYKAAATEAK